MTIKIENLSHSFGKIAALKDISTSIKPKSITVLIGPNAAGKSTLLRCIIGAIRPNSGKVLIDKMPAHKLSARVLAKCAAYVPQRPIVSAAFSVREVVELGRYVLPRNISKVDKALDQLDLTKLEDRAFQNLSVGQQQRVALARAFAQISVNGHLILDEPMSAMDLNYVYKCVDLLRAKAESGATVILALHDLSLAATIADNVLLLDNGKLILSGDVNEVMQPGHLTKVFGIELERVARAGGKDALLVK
ncbi:MAG: ABC transporter ATP-binding protein [Planctomycetes bacterium]|nr:ABC transporter ATP-binding protein [Planctomycetota bacterium]